MSLVQEIDYGTPRSKSEKMITLTIDGQPVTVPEGTSIMRAAMEMGTKIPKLCATDMLDAFGSCRLCLVEIDGRPGTPASCTTPAANGMVVHTQTERLKTDAQRRHGALHLRAPARLPDLLGQRRLRTCRTWPARSACAKCVTATTARGTPIRASTCRTPISPTSRRSASFAHAACAPARKCRERSR